MRAVLFGGLAEAEAALAAEVAAGTGGVLLLSAPGAAAFPGPAVLGAVIEAAARRQPAARFAAALDCGDMPGLALHALRLGWRRLLLDAAHPARAAVASSAASVGAALLPARPEALDLRRYDLGREAGRRAAAARLADWLRLDAGGGFG